MRRRLLGGATGSVDAGVSAEDGDPDAETLASGGVSAGDTRTGVGREAIAA